MYFDRNRFADPVKKIMLALNVWHFFVRKNSFPRCWTNLMESFDSKKVQKLGVKTQADVRNTCEVLFIGYICGIVMMPGGNQQF